MKRRIIAIAAATIFAAASTLPAVAADVIKFEAKNGTVTFEHKAHQERVQGDCTKCHQGAPGKMNLGKDKAHELCIGCHKAMAAGPSKCNECHKK